MQLTNCIKNYLSMVSACLIKTLAALACFFVFGLSPLYSDEQIADDNNYPEIRKEAVSCRDEIVALFEECLKSGTLTMAQLFDTFYIPVPKTDPPRFNTQYNRVVEYALQSILDSYLNKNASLHYVIAVDKYGFLPAQNSKFSSSRTGSREEEYQRDIAGQILNDRVGLAASGNKKPCLVQEYTGYNRRKILDISVPILIETHHWGAVRFGFKP